MRPNGRVGRTPSDYRGLTIRQLAGICKPEISVRIVLIANPVDQSMSTTYVNGEYRISVIPAKPTNWHNADDLEWYPDPK